MSEAAVTETVVARPPKLPRVTPPVTVTPLISTRGGAAGCGVATVMTGPPPTMLVRVAPAPTSRRLLEIVTPPA